MSPRLRIWHVGNWCIHLGRKYVESPFEAPVKDVEVVNYGTDVRRPRDDPDALGRGCACVLRPGTADPRGHGQPVTGGAIVWMVIFGLSAVCFFAVAAVVSVLGIADVRDLLRRGHSIPRD